MRPVRPRRVGPVVWATLLLAASVAQADLRILLVAKTGFYER